MDIKREKRLMKTIIASQFNYHLDIWMFYSRKVKYHINELHKVTLKLIQNDKKITMINFYRKTTLLGSMILISSSWELKFQNEQECT